MVIYEGENTFTLTPKYETHFRKHQSGKFDIHI